MSFEGALLLAALTVGDPKAGEAIYARRAGSVPGFEYSPAMKRSRLVWDEKTLNRFLADPLKAVPGTTMTYAGVEDPKERADLIAYLGSVACDRRL